MAAELNATGLSELSIRLPAHDELDFSITRVDDDDVASADNKAIGAKPYDPIEHHVGEPMQLDPPRHVWPSANLISTSASGKSGPMLSRIRDLSQLTSSKREMMTAGPLRYSITSTIS
jgi:hypothetical protein